MRPVNGISSILSVVALAAFTGSPCSGQVSYWQPAAAGPGDDTAIAAVIAANGGKVPATGEELCKALAKLGRFAQLPIPFSAVHLESGIRNPRVVIAPHVAGVSRADVTGPNIDGRLFLAANTEPSADGDPHVSSVEFISWNASRRRFDFGVIENMGPGGAPRLQVLDGGKCFSCHKNRGPILGARPWSNSTHDDILRYGVASTFRLGGTGLPQTGPFALPQKTAAGVLQRERIDGLALAMPEAMEVDAAVRQGAALQTNRDVFRLMTRTPDGRKGLVVLFVALAEPGTLDANEKSVKHALDAAFAPSFYQFATDWVDLQKAAKPNALIDVDPSELLTASGVRPSPRGSVSPSVPVMTVPVVSVPGLVGGSGSRWILTGVRAASAPPVVTRTKVVDPVALNASIQAAKEKKANEDYAASLIDLGRYEIARSAGSHGLSSKMQPSNPRAFVKPTASVPKRPSDVLNAVMLADTIGLTDGDRKFMTLALADAAKRVNQPKVTAATLAHDVFEGPHFTDVLAGGPLPDRDEFKDRFVAGLADVLKARGTPGGFAPNRRDYASGPRYDPTAAEEKEVAIVPTTACLRCHEVGGPGKAARFDPIPPLAFDPFDKPGRAAWVKAADPNRKRAVLGRMVLRLATDADMPPADAPEHDRFRVKEAAAFDDVKRFLAAELEKVREK